MAIPAAADALVELNAISAALKDETPLMTRVRALSYIAIAYAESGQFERAFEQLEQVTEIAAQSQLPDAETEVAATRVYMTQLQGKTSAALAQLNDVLIPLEQAKLPRVRYFASNIVASLYRQRSNFAQALEYYIKAADAIAETNDSRTVLRLLSTKAQISRIYAQQKSYDLALQQIDEAEHIATEHGLLDEFQLHILFERAGIETERGNFDTALAIYAQLQQQLKNDPNQVDNYLTALNNIGDIDMRTQRYQEAYQVLQEALSIAKLNPEKTDSTVIAFNLGYVDVFLGNTERGVEQMQDAIAKVKDDWSPAAFEGLLGEYAEALAHSGDFAAAYATLIEQRDLREQAYQTEQQKNMAELQNLYDSKDKAMQIELLEQKNALSEQLIENESQQRTILLLLVIVAAFAMVLIGLLYRAARRNNLELQVANTKLSEQSIRDPLTGLLNRRALQDKLKLPHEASNDAMILLDVDHFKRINDNFGHAFGDEVLIEVAKRLETVSRDSDLVVRWGGEEFLIYLTNTAKSKLPDMAQRMLAIIGNTPVTVGEQQVYITATAGFICYPFADLPEQAMNWEETLQLADMVLYAGKVHGRNQAWGVMSLNRPFATVQKLLESDLPAAIEQKVISVEIIKGP